MPDSAVESDSKVANIDLVYLSLPVESGIAKGFYTVKMALLPGTSSRTAQLIDGAGSVAANLAVQNDVNALIIRIVFTRIVFTVIIGRNFV